LPELSRGGAGGDDPSGGTADGAAGSREGPEGREPLEAVRPPPGAGGEATEGAQLSPYQRALRDAWKAEQRASDPATLSLSGDLLVVIMAGAGEEPAASGDGPGKADGLREAGGVATQAERVNGLLTALELSRGRGAPRDQAAVLRKAEELAAGQPADPLVAARLDLARARLASPGEASAEALRSAAEALTEQVAAQAGSQGTDPYTAQLAGRAWGDAARALLPTDVDTEVAREKLASRPALAASLDGAIGAALRLSARAGDDRGAVLAHQLQADVARLRDDTAGQVAALGAKADAIERTGNQWEWRNALMRVSREGEAAGFHDQAATRYEQLATLLMQKPELGLYLKQPFLADAVRIRLDGLGRDGNPGLVLDTVGKLLNERTSTLTGRPDRPAYLATAEALESAFASGPWALVPGRSEALVGIMRDAPGDREGRRELAWLSYVLEAHHALEQEHDSAEATDAELQRLERRADRLTELDSTLTSAGDELGAARVRAAGRDRTYGDRSGGGLIPTLTRLAEGYEKAGMRSEHADAYERIGAVNKRHATRILQAPELTPTAEGSQSRPA
jgi:hypothetical protein